MWCLSLFNKLYCSLKKKRPWSSVLIYRLNSLMLFSKLFLPQSVSRSEHERHSPNCPFVKGEHTQNVPLSVTLATSPAQFPCTDGTDRISCFGSGSCPHFLAAATKRGKICIWDVSKLMKVCFNFEVIY